MALSVHRPAVASPVDSSGISVTKYYREQLIKSPLVLVPPSFELSGDPNKVLGEQAEKKVIDSAEKCRDISGSKSFASMVSR